jgi:hypothetical protein
LFVAGIPNADGRSNPCHVDVIETLYAFGMDIDRATCHTTDHSQDSLADKLSALFQSSELFGHGNDQPESKANESGAQCASTSSPFELPPLALTQSGPASAGDKEQSIDASMAKLEPVVGKAKLSEVMTHMANFPQSEKGDFLRSLNSIMEDASKASDLATRVSNLATRASDLPTRKLMVNEVIDQVDHPEKIKQGYKGTCGLAAVEIDVAASRPDVYARAVAQWSKLIDHGSSKGNDVSAALHNPNLIIDRDDASHHRSLVSRVFQNGAINLMLAGSGKRYESFTPAEAPEIKTKDGSFKPERDSGERVLDSTGKVLTWDGVSAEDQADLLSKLTSKHFTPGKIYPTSADDLAGKLKDELAKSNTPTNLELHSVLGAHAITVVKVGDQNHSPDVFYLNSASGDKKVLHISAEKLYDSTIDGDDVVRIGSTEVIDGLTFRKPYKLPADAKPFVSIVHAD